jgi:hypothetical protein
MKIVYHIDIAMKKRSFLASGAGLVAYRPAQGQSDAEDVPTIERDQESSAHRRQIGLGRV